MKMKRLVALLLALACLLPLVACGDTPGGGGGEGGGGGGKTDPPVTLVTENGATFDIVPTAVAAHLANAKTYDVNDYSYSVDTSAATSAAAVAVTLSWTVDPTADITAATLLVSEYDDLSDAWEYDVRGLSSKAVYNLKTGTTYYWRVDVTLRGAKKPTVGEARSFTTLPGIRILNLPGIGNNRDIGGRTTLDGKTVKQGMAYRTRRLDAATEDTIRFLIDNLGIVTEVDLRADGTKCAFSEEVTYVRFGSSQYDRYFETSAQQTTAEIMRMFTDPANYPILFHCVGGADRTGSLAIMLELLLGMSENDAVADYELTPNRHRYPMPADSGYTCHEMMLALHKMKGDTMQEKAYNFYHDTCGLTAMELSNIYNLMMNDSGVFTKRSLGAQTFSVTTGASFGVDLRLADGIESVTVGGKSVAFDYEDGVLTFGLETTGDVSGVITFTDGETLKFECRATL